MNRDSPFWQGGVQSFAALGPNRKFEWFGHLIRHPNWPAMIRARKFKKGPRNG